MRPWAIAVCFLLLTGIPGLRGSALAGFDPEAIYQVADDGAPSSGNPLARVTIVEFSDYACGYCIRARATMAALKLLYPAQLRWIHRSVPFISGTTLGAEAAHAAAFQGHFEAMEARLYAAAGRYDRVTVEMLAQGLGLDMIRFRADLDSGSARQAIAEDVALARRLGVSATPTFFVNGRPILGSQPVATFVKVIDEELARAGTVQSIAGESAGTLERVGELYDRLTAQGRTSADDGPRVNPAQVELNALVAYRVGTGLPGLQRGPPSAPVTLVVFSDFECRFCTSNEASVRYVQRIFGASLRVIFRHMLGVSRSVVLCAFAADPLGPRAHRRGNRTRARSVSRGSRFPPLPRRRASGCSGRHGVGCRRHTNHVPQRHGDFRWQAAAGTRAGRRGGTRPRHEGDGSGRCAS
jgi:protein-disulfide isomerase